MARLRRVDCSESGIVRRRRGKGFEYLDSDGRRITEPSVLDRIRELPHLIGFLESLGRIDSTVHAIR